jgi:hypothetical protein
MAAIHSKASAPVAESNTRSAAAASSPATARELRHDLGNALGALRLRVQLVLTDPACRAAQAKNLEAIERILNRSMDLFAALHTRPGSKARSAAPKSKKRKRVTKRR